MTDTVGFIRKLPHQLVDAFAATLEETKRADLLLHVVDASAPEEELLEMTRAVEDVLEEIGVGDQPRILVLNKADQLDDERRHELRSATPTPRWSARSPARGSRSCRSGSPTSSSASCATSSCSSRSPRAARCPSCTTSPATSSAPTRPRACRVLARLPAVIAERFDRYAVNGRP